MKMWIIAAAGAAALASLAGVTRPPAAGAAAAPAAASFGLSDVAFLAGAWRGDRDGDLVEEHWTAPSGSNITGMFRWVGADGGVRLVELLTISQEAGAVVLRLRHFDGALTPWKSETAPVALKLAEKGPDRAVFRADGGGPLAAVTYHVSAPDRLEIVVEFPAGDGRDPLEFGLTRAAAAAK